MFAARSYRIFKDFFFFTQRSQPNCCSLSYKTEEISQISTNDLSPFLNKKVFRHKEETVISLSYLSGAWFMTQEGLEGLSRSLQLRTEQCAVILMCNSPMSRQVLAWVSLSFTKPSLPFKAFSSSQVSEQKFLFLFLAVHFSILFFPFLTLPHSFSRSVFTMSLGWWEPWGRAAPSCICAALRTCLELPKCFAVITSLVVWVFFFLTLPMWSLHREPEEKQTELASPHFADVSIFDYLLVVLSSVCANVKISVLGV